ncbi:unannotated protein [freshwater metagenome]|uniref:Unannotated protein n=1 Tax=freshwater metagenome TaxID=449393 RepID=A0A6J7L1Z2_9ZZZZ
MKNRPGSHEGAEPVDQTGEYYEAVTHGMGSAVVVGATPL